MKFRFLITSFLLICGIVTSFGQSAEFSTATGFDVFRIENEIKLSIPDEVADDVWKYLNTRYNNDDLYLRKYDPTFATKVAIDSFIDQYYDNKEMQVLQAQHGIRHRSRYVLTDSSDRKHGRQLMQFKVNAIDGNELNRGEYKYEIKYSGKPNQPLDIHPFFNNIRQDLRQPITERLAEHGIDAFSLFPTIRIDQIRKRVYISLRGDAFATMTLDFVTANFGGKATKYVELELELNEINYTLGDSTTRATMEAINEDIKGDLLKTFPSIVQDQTPKYNKGFVALGLKDFEYRPLFGMTDKSISLIVLAILVLGVVLYHWRERKEQKSYQDYLSANPGIKTDVTPS